MVTGKQEKGLSGNNESPKARKPETGYPASGKPSGCRRPSSRGDEERRRRTRESGSPAIQNARNHEIRKHRNRESPKPPCGDLVAEASGRRQMSAQGHGALKSDLSQGSNQAQFRVPKPQMLQTSKPGISLWRYGGSRRPRPAGESRKALNPESPNARNRGNGKAWFATRQHGIGIKCRRTRRAGNPETPIARNH